MSSDMSRTINKVEDSLIVSTMHVDLEDVAEIAMIVGFFKEIMI
jgi:hypothetical protein